MRIILAGATGFLGRKLLKRLLESGHRVLCPIFNGNIDEFSAHSACEIISTEDFAFVETVQRFGPEIVINASGVYDRRGIPVSHLTEGNIIFPLRLLNMVLEGSEGGGKFRMWINSCTSLPEYLDTYTMSKYQLAHWGRIYAERHNFTFVNVLLEHFYGPFDKNVKFIQFVLEKLFANECINLTAGLQERDFIYVDDVVDGYMAILCGDLKGYNNISLGSGECVAIRTLVEFLKREAGSSSILNFDAVPLRENEPMRLISDLTAMRSLGFTPKYSWQDGMKKTIDEMRRVLS